MKHRYTSEDGSSGVWLTAETQPAYCDWSWDEEDLTLRVSKGYHSRQVKVPAESFAAGDILAELAELPRLAKRIADDICCGNT